MLRAKWNRLEAPNKLTDEQLVSKYRFYKAIQRWKYDTDNELLDKILDLLDEIKSRRLNNS